MSMARMGKSLAIAIGISLVPGPAFAGRISGRFLDPAGDPVAGVEVALTRELGFAAETLARVKRLAPRPVAVTRSGEDGRFELKISETRGAYRATASASGYASLLLAQGFDASGAEDLGTIVLQAATPIVGRVVDQQGRTVSGARVRVLSPAASSLAGGESDTSPTGEFRITDHPGGPATLMIEKEGYIVAGDVPSSPGPNLVTLKRGVAVTGTVVSPDGRRAVEAVVWAQGHVTLTDSEGRFSLSGLAGTRVSILVSLGEKFVGRADGITISGAKPAAAEIRLKPALSLSGLVRDDSTREPIRGASVTLGVPDFLLAGPLGSRALTDSRGAFRMPGLLPGRYPLAVTREGYLRWSAPIADVAPAAKPLVIALTREARLSGRVVDEGGRPVSGAELTLGRANPLKQFFRQLRAERFQKEKAFADRAGRFEFRGLVEATDLKLDAAAPGFAAAQVTGISLAAGDIKSGILIRLHAGLTAKGRVTDKSGQPLAGVAIRVERQPEGMFRSPFPERSTPQAYTDKDGLYVLTNLELAAYQISASRSGYSTKTISGVKIGDGQKELPKIALEPAASVAGVVLDGQGQALAGATVAVLDLTVGESSTTQSDPRGRFRVDNLSAGIPLFLAARLSGRAVETLRVTPPAADVVFKLKDTATVAGTVLDDDSEAPVRDFSLEWSRPRAAGTMTTTIGGGTASAPFHSKEGAFELPNIPPGRAVLTARARGYQDGHIELDLSQDERREGVVLRLSRGASVDGRTVDDTGRPVSNASVAWTKAGSDKIEASDAAMMVLTAGTNLTVSDADGRFHFDGLPLRRLTFLASNPRYLEATKDVDPSKTKEFQIVLRSGAAVGGIVTGGDNRPAVGATVRLLATGDEQVNKMNIYDENTTAADGAGRFRFEHLHAGTYRLVATGRSGSSAPLEVVLGEGTRREDLLLQLGGGTTIRGSVTGLAPERRGGVRVMAHGTDSFDATDTDPAGSFVFRHVQPGTYQLEASTSMSGGQSASKWVTVLEDQRELDVEIEFTGKNRLQGKVTRHGEGVPSLRVVAVPHSAAIGSRGVGVTDAAGAYSIEGLDDGLYTVLLEGPGVRYQKDFDLQGDTSGDIELPTLSVSGQVTEAETGRPLEGASVTAQTGSEDMLRSIRSASTDSSGRYELADLDPGAYRLTASRDGYSAQTRAASVGDGPAVADFALERGSGLRLQAIDGRTALPLRGLAVLVFASDRTLVYSGPVSLDTSGAGEIPGLAPGLYTVSVSSLGYAPQTLPGITVPGPTVSLALTPGGRLEIRGVPGLSGTAWITTSLEMPYLVTWGRLDNALALSGEITVVPQIAPGAYRLVVQTGSQPSAYAFVVREGETTVVALN